MVLYYATFLWKTMTTPAVFQEFTMGGHPAQIDRWGNIEPIITGTGSVIGPGTVITGGLAVTSITSAPGDESIVQSGGPGVAGVKALTAGTGGGLSSDANAITVTNSTLLTSVGTGQTLVSSGSPATYSTKSRS